MLCVSSVEHFESFVRTKTLSSAVNSLAFCIYTILAMSLRDVLITVSFVRNTKGLIQFSSEISSRLAFFSIHSTAPRSKSQPLAMMSPPLRQ
jgi:hypothetical protein